MKEQFVVDKYFTLLTPEALLSFSWLYRNEQSVPAAYAALYINGNSSTRSNNSFKVLLFLFNSKFTKAVYLKSFDQFRERAKSSASFNENKTG